MSKLIIAKSWIGIWCTDTGFELSKDGTVLGFCGFTNSGKYSYSEQW